MTSIPKLSDNALQAICDLLGDTGSGLTGTEIGKLLDSSGIEDVEPSITKRHRLFSALKHRQEKDRCSNNVFAFIQNVMDPVRYAQNREYFNRTKDQLNVILALQGYELRADGKIVQATLVTTLDDAHLRANALQKKLSDRGVHYYVLNFCRAEFLQENYFHAVFEATKSIADRLREMSDQDKDGTQLVEATLGGQKPVLAINSLRTETEKMEQAGFANLLKGIFGMFRNTTAHAPKIKWKIEERDALELLTMASFAHRKLDDAVRTDY